MKQLFGQGILAVLVTIAALLAQDTVDAGHLIASDLRAGKSADARELLDAALKKSPRDARLWTLNGLALAQLGKQSDALASYKTALRLSPEYVPALESAAEIEFKMADPGAAELVRRLLKIRPNDKTSHAMVAAITFERGECEAAGREFALSQESASRSSSLEELGSCMVKHKRTAEAIPVFKTISELNPADEQSLYKLAVVQFLAKKYGDVLSSLRPLLAGTQPNADALELAAETYQAASDPQRAMDALQQAIAGNPDLPRYYVEFANLCLAHGASPLGIEVLNAGLQRIPDSAALYLARGLLFSELAQYEKGEADFNTAERLDPGVEFASAIRGLAELQQNKLGDAEALIRERLRSHPDDALLHYLLAEVLIKKAVAPGSPEFQEALNAATKSVQLQPSLEAARNVLGRLYLEQGNTDGAIEQSRMALRSNPNDATALYRLVLALRKAGKTEEVPALLNRLIALRAQAQRKDAAEREYVVAGDQPGTRNQSAQR